MSTADCFSKPIMTRDRLLALLPALPGHLLRALPTVRGRVLSAADRERVMLAVATENRCPYCQLTHGALGRLAGLERAEVEALLQARDDERGQEEARALMLAYVRDLARRGFGSRDEALRRQLGDSFSEAQLRAMESVAQLMDLANRFGNTFDATRAHLARRCCSCEASLGELLPLSGVFLLAAALLGPAVGSLAALLRPPLPPEWRAHGAQSEPG